MVIELTLYPRVDVQVVGKTVKAGDSVEVTDESAIAVLLKSYATDYYVMEIKGSNGYVTYRASDGKAWIPTGSFEEAVDISGYEPPPEPKSKEHKKGKKHDTSKKGSK